MASRFTVPEKFVGKTLSQIQGETGTPFRADLLGFDPNTALTSGQAFDFPGATGSAESQFLTSQFLSPGQVQQAGQKAEGEAFIGALEERIGGQEKLGAASERIGGELNLPTLRRNAFDLQQTLKNVGARQQGQAQQFGISAPNLARRTAAEQARLAPAAQEATAQAQFAEGELGRNLQLLVAEQDKELRPFFEAQLPLLQDRLAREQSNYQLDQQRELDVLLANIAQSGQASREEAARIQELSVLEETFNKTLEQIAFQTDEQIRKAAALKAQNQTNTGNIESDIIDILRELNVDNSGGGGSIRILE